MKQDACLIFPFSTSERAKPFSFHCKTSSWKKIPCQTSRNYTPGDSSAFLLFPSFTSVLFKLLSLWPLPEWRRVRAKCRSRVWPSQQQLPCHICSHLGNWRPKASARSPAACLPAARAPGSPPPCRVLPTPWGSYPPNPRKQPTLAATSQSSGAYGEGCGSLGFSWPRPRLMSSVFHIPQ